MAQIADKKLKKEESFLLSAPAATVSQQSFEARLAAAKATYARHLQTVEGLLDDDDATLSTIQDAKARLELVATAVAQLEQLCKPSPGCI